MMSMCSPMVGQFFDTMIVASTDEEWMKWHIKLSLSAGNCFEPP